MGLWSAITGAGETGLGKGDTAPAFALKSQTGEVVQSSDFLGKQNVVVYFYPKDDTPGCTRESCSFRDQFADLQDAGAQVIGISGDSVESHRRFAEKHRLPFLLLADEGNLVRKAFKVPTSLGVLPGRVTYVIDKQGVIQHAFNSQTNPTKHVEESLQVLRALP